MVARLAVHSVLTNFNSHIQRTRILDVKACEETTSEDLKHALMCQIETVGDSASSCCRDIAFGQITGF